MKSQEIPLNSAEESTVSSPPTVFFELKNVSRYFGEVRAVRNINLRIYKGERVVLIGPSGAGKSSLLNLLNGSIFPSDGELRIFGEDVFKINNRKLKRIQSKIGTVYQQFHLVDRLQVIHNVNAGNLGRWSFLKAASSLLWPQEVEKANQALTQVGIPEKIYERTDNLSGGQQQRVALARLLVQDPEVILADEPISNVDPERSREIMNLLLRLSQHYGRTLITSLHTIEYAFSHFERLIGLRHGQILFDAPANQVTSKMVDALYTIEEEPIGR